ncbi:YeiH family protein [Weissella confusa]|uniref:YeiH family protein n=1 Tax=Weissella confusa TaxID=1583 RepID=UPI00108039DB|nr:putative sulfate exporter family transporter [Weissella confusa]MBJ7629333.1 putative sulfate exporter family transporter [Weissella confusa]MCG4286828.1 putative sulfate exporter family transporter [Weissella cibaria]MCT0950916.1 putative sulfate exporter family transporter [Weissella cibaria]TGE46113.1 putative sulfate exporter family transporter [Weissella confusa]
MRIKKNMVAGIVLTLALALVAKLLSPFLPTLGAEALAMLAGIVLGNTVFANQRWGAGVKWAEKYPIEIGIALLGLNVTLQNMESIGWSGVIFILLQMALTILFVMWIGGRVFKVSPQSAMMMGAGNAVCGSSAIASVAPAVGATDDQRRTSVATVSLAGVILLFVLPVIGPAILPNNMMVSALIGGTVQSVGQVSGTASLVGGSVVTYAPIFKMLRVIMLSVVVIFMANHASKLSNLAATTSAKSANKTKINIPWFVTVFIIFMLINSFVTLPHVLTNSAEQVTSFFGVVNLAGIGLNLKWSTIKSSGAKFLGYGLVTIIFQVAIAIALIYVLMG